MEKMKASLNAEVPADAAERRGRDGDRGARPGPAQVLAMGSSRRSGWTRTAGDQLRAAYEPVNLGAGSVYKIFTTATAWRRAWASTTDGGAPRGYASPIYIDGNGRPIPVNNAGDYADSCR